MRILINTHRALSVQILICVAAALIIPGWVSTDLQAETFQITYTAEDLFNGGAIFPVLDRQPELRGTAPGKWLYFGPVTEGTARWQKLMELPIFPTGTIPPGETCIISVVINHTWIPNAGTNEVNDWDPHFMIGDSSHLLGVTTLEQGGIDMAWCEDFLVEVEDLPYPPCGSCPEDPSEICCSQWVSYQGLADGQPSLDVPYDLSLEFGLNFGDPARTYVWVNEGNLDSTGWNWSPVALNPAGPMTFFFVSDNQLHEEYRINSVTVTVSELLTCNCGNPGSSILLWTRT